MGSWNATAGWRDRRFWFGTGSSIPEEDKPRDRIGPIRRWIQQSAALASLPGPVGRGDFLVHKDGLALLAGGPRGELMRLVAEGELDQAKGLHAWYEREFGSNYYIHHELGQELDIFALFPEEKFVMCQDVRYLEAPSLLTLEVLGKIKGGKAVCRPSLLSWPELCKAFQGPDKVVQQTLALAKRCNAKLPRERTLPPHPAALVFRT